MEKSGDQLDIKTSLKLSMHFCSRLPSLGHLSDLQGQHRHCVCPNFGRANHPTLIISYDFNKYKIEIVEHSGKLKMTNYMFL